MSNFQRLPSDFHGRRILVLGDMMLDRYVYGCAHRLSPEAPVPILRIEREDVLPGGAANVAVNVASLGGHPILIGSIGDDEAGRTLQKILAGRFDIGVDNLVVIPGGRTTEKIRYVADHQQIMRADIDMSGAPPDAILERFARQLPSADAVVLSDYAKGALDARLVAAVIARARAGGKPVIVDPKSSDLGRYDGAAMLTPNQGEAGLATDIAGDDDASAAGCAEAILGTVPACSAVLITRGARGMTLLERGRGVRHIPAVAREVFDVSGAGDTVIATLALSIASGHEPAVAAQLANSAAGIVVSKAGTACVDGNELTAALQSAVVHGAELKIAALDTALAAIARWRARGERVGFTNGCFDLIHPGHISLLSQARTKCDRLVVGLNSDSSVQRLKGAGRPIQDETARAIVLASLGVVDQVVLFDADTPLDLISAIRPDVLVKGADYTEEQVVGADIVRSYGGEVFLAALTADQSTTRTIARFIRTGS